VFKFILEDYREAIFVFDEAAAAEWGRMMASSPAMPYDDSLIAAIARSCDLIVVTRNEKHFPACDTVNPWTD
jgi:predicted nucleic acid-binding protein